MTQSCTTMMYAKYTQAGFDAVTASIVQNAAAEPTSKIGTSFSTLTPTQVMTLQTHLDQFLVMVYGGPNNYQGVSMPVAHMGLAITMDQYNNFITDVVVPALASNGVSMSDITNCFAPPVTDPGFIAMIVGH